MVKQSDKTEDLKLFKTKQAPNYGTEGFLPPTIYAVDFDDVQTFFEEIVKDPNLLHTDELKFVKTFLENFNATIPKLKVEKKEEKGNEDASEDAKPAPVEEEEEESSAEEDEEEEEDLPQN